MNAPYRSASFRLCGLHTSRPFTRAPVRAVDAPARVLLVVVLLVAGCAARPSQPPQTPVTDIPRQGDWFCQMAADGSGWECVQDPDLAREPAPERLPGADGTAGPQGPRPDDSPEPDLPPAPPAPTLPAPPEPILPEDLPRDGAPPAGESTQTVGAPAEPAYVRLAYQPPQPVALAELPPHFYMVQLTAMSSRQALEEFVQRKRVEGLSAARVERDGSLYYVLLLGVYETLETAQRAALDLPGALQRTTPWIRPLKSLQSAIIRADALAGARGL